MDVEKEIFYPYGGVRSPVVLFYVHGFKPFRELVLHDLICKALWVDDASDPGYSVSEIGCWLCLV